MSPSNKASALKAGLTALRAAASAKLPAAPPPSPSPAASTPPPHEGAGLELGRFLARGFDELLASVFEAVPARNVAFAAVGGYGRGAVALRSDLDVRFPHP